MSKRTAILEALLLGGIPFLAGGFISASPMLIFGFNIVNMVGVIVCFIVGALGGLYAYSVNADKIKEESE